MPSAALRAWEPVRRGQRVFVERVVEPQARVHRTLIDRERSLLDRIRRDGARAAERHPWRGRAYWLVVGVPYGLVRGLVALHDRLGGGLIHGQRQVAEGVAELPATLHAGVQASRRELSTPDRRAELLRSVVDESRLTARRRQALLFLALLGLPLLWLIAEILVRGLWPELMGRKRAIDGLFFYGLATRFFLPTPLELVVSPGARMVGPVAALAAAVLGAVAGSWLLLIAGTRAHESIAAWVHGQRWGERAWAWLDRNAHRFGYVLLGLVLAIPFAPDSITVLFAMLGLRMAPFLLTVLAATTARLALVLWLL